MRAVIRTTVAAAAAMQMALGTTADVADACTLLSPEEIQKITARSDVATGKPNLIQTQSGSECLYSGAVGVGVYLRPMTKQEFAKLRDEEKKSADSKQEAVSGVGDEAYFMIDKRYVVLKARVGERSFHVAMDLEGTATAALKPMAVALGKAAAAKLL